MAREKKQKKKLTEEEVKELREKKFEEFEKKSERFEKNYRYFTDRVTAYLIDLLIVVFLSTMLATSTVTNPFYNNTTEAYNEFKEVYETTLEEVNKDGKIETKESEKLMNKVGPTFRTYYIRSKFAIYLWYIVLYFFYFGFFAYLNNGQTIGKKLYRLKVVEKDSTKKPSLVKMMRRCFFGGMSVICGNNIAVILLLGTMALVKPPFPFMVLIALFTALGFILDFVFVLLYVFKKNHRTLDDLIGNTKVISMPKKNVSKEI